MIRLAIKQERDELARREASVILPVLQPHEGPEEEQPYQRNPYSSAKKLTKPGKPGLPGYGDIGIKPIDSLDVLPPGLLDYLLVSDEALELVTSEPFFRSRLFSHFRTVK